MFLYCPQVIGRLNWWGGRGAVPDLPEWCYISNQPSADALPVFRQPAVHSPRLSEEMDPDKSRVGSVLRERDEFATVRSINSWRKPEWEVKRERLNGANVVIFMHASVCVFAGSGLSVVKTCELCKGRLTLDLQNFDLDDYYQRHRQQVNWDKMDLRTKSKFKGIESLPRWFITPLLSLQGHFA